jgi:hypothetical protein
LLQPSPAGLFDHGFRSVGSGHKKQCRMPDAGCRMPDAGCPMSLPSQPVVQERSLPFFCACMLPVVQPTPTSRCRGKSQPGWQMVTSHVSLQHFNTNRRPMSARSRPAAHEGVAGAVVRAVGVAVRSVPRFVIDYRYRHSLIRCSGIQGSPFCGKVNILSGFFSNRSSSVALRDRPGHSRDRAQTGLAGHRRGGRPSRQQGFLC